MSDGDDAIGGPYLSVACLCESVIEDKNGRYTLVNLIDRVTLETADIASPEEMPPLTMRAQLVLGFKSGFYRGSASVKASMKAPSGKLVGQTTFPALFEGEDRGIVITSNLQVVLREEGLYWIDVLLQEQLITRIPLRVIYQRIVTG